MHVLSLDHGPHAPMKYRPPPSRKAAMLKFLLWCLLLVVCWPVALLALVLYPVVWLLLLPFRVLGIAVDGVLELLRAIVTFPARVLGGGRRAALPSGPRD